MSAASRLLTTTDELQYNESQTKASTKDLTENSVASKANTFNASFTHSVLPFINGGLAGTVATTVVQPIDMVKVRLQLAGEGARADTKVSPFSITREIISAGKVTDLYTGLSAGLLRQAIYTTARLGFFDSMMKYFTVKASAHGKNIGFKERASAGLMAGGLAAILGNPADLALIRMQSDGMKPFVERRNYRSVFAALTGIARTEGLASLWAGATPTIGRAMALNFGQLAFFSEAKQRLGDSGFSPKFQTLGASAIAGFFASFFSLPFDFTKTRLQKQVKGVDGRFPYQGMFDCFAKVARDEGVMRFYRGFGTYYARIAPHV